MFGCSCLLLLPPALCPLPTAPAYCLLPPTNAYAASPLPIPLVLAFPHHSALSTQYFCLALCWNLLEKVLKIQLRRADKLPNIDRAARSMTKWLETGKM